MPDPEDIWQNADRQTTAVDHNDGSTTEWIMIDNENSKDKKSEDVTVKEDMKKVNGDAQGTKEDTVTMNGKKDKDITDTK